MFNLFMDIFIQSIQKHVRSFWHFSLIFLGRTRPTQIHPGHASKPTTSQKEVYQRRSNMIALKRLEACAYPKKHMGRSMSKGYNHFWITVSCVVIG